MNDFLKLVLLSSGTLIIGLLIGYLVARSSFHTRYRNKKTNALREAERQEHEHSMTIYKLVSKLSATLNYEKVLEIALDMSSSVLSAASDPGGQLVSAALLFAIDENDPAKTKLRISSARRFTPADLRILLDAKSGILARTIEQSEPQGTKEVSLDPELGRIIAIRSCNGAYLIPLRSGLDTYGVLAFAHPLIDYFTPERREALDIIGNQVMIALQNARLYRDLEQEKERMMEIQEEARRKLARDLHDGPTQSVAAIAMRVNFARRLMERESVNAADELSKIEDLARRTTKEIRHMLFTLRPLVLESKGLVAALEAMAEKMKDTYDQNVIVDADPSLVDAIEMGKQAVIFYIVEEAVNNARKHAEAAHVWVKIKSIQPDIALIAVEDDGVGFNVGAVDATYDNRGSLGMINMRERTELVNGILNIDSAEGKGTRIHVAIPLTEEAHDRLRNRRPN